MNNNIDYDKMATFAERYGGTVVSMHPRQCGKTEIYKSVVKAKSRFIKQIEEERYEDMLAAAEVKEVMKIGVIYDKDGDFMDVRVMNEGKKDVDKYLSRPENLGRTVVLFKIGKSYQTSIPVVEVK